MHLAVGYIAAQQMLIVKGVAKTILQIKLKGKILKSKYAHEGSK